MHLIWISTRQAWTSAPKGTRPRHLHAATCMPRVARQPPALSVRCLAAHAGKEVLRGARTLSRPFRTTAGSPASSQAATCNHSCQLAQGTGRPADDMAGWRRRQITGLATPRQPRNHCRCAVSCLVRQVQDGWAVWLIGHI